MFRSHLHENTHIYYEVNSAYGVRKIVAIYSQNQSKQIPLLGEMLNQMVYVITTAN
jgi:hypothetical protein